MDEWAGELGPGIVWRAGRASRVWGELGFLREGAQWELFSEDAGLSSLALEGLGATSPWNLHQYQIMARLDQNCQARKTQILCPREWRLSIK